MEHPTFAHNPQDMAPVLARLNAAYALYKDSRDQRPMARVHLTALVSDLMALNLTQQETDMVADILITLTRQAEVDLRKAIAERLSSLDNVPVRLVMQMANDEIAVAHPVLRSSPVLGDMQLMDIIAHKGTEHWKVIAGRRNLSDLIIDRLADTRDYPTATTLAENITITLTPHSIAILAHMAECSENLAMPLLRRGEIPDAIASQLYRHVGQTLKKFILRNYEVDTQDLMETLDDVVLEFVDRAQIQEEESHDSSLPVSSLDARALPTQAMLRAASQFRQKGLLTIQLMLNTLRRGQVPSFIAQLSIYSGLEPVVVSEILHQRKAKGIAIICKASSFGRPDFVSIYLLTHSVRGCGQLIDLQDMTSTMGMYDHTAAEVARQIIAQSLDKLVSGA